MFDRRTKHSHEIFSQLQIYFGRQICGLIHYSVRLSEAPAHGKTILEYAARARGAQDYDNLVKSINNYDG